MLFLGRPQDDCATNIHVLIPPFEVGTPPECRPGCLSRTLVLASGKGAGARAGQQTCAPGPRLSHPAACGEEITPGARDRGACGAERPGGDTGPARRRADAEAPHREGPGSGPGPSHPCWQRETGQTAMGGQALVRGPRRCPARTWPHTASGEVSPRRGRGGEMCRGHAAGQTCSQRSAGS